MNYLQFGYFVLGIGVLFLLPHAHGQYFYDANVTYIADFEYTHRGTFNMSYCSKELINCWELMQPPEMMCYYHLTFESVCGVMRNFCYDAINDSDKYYKYNFDLREGMCPSYNPVYKYSETFANTRRMNAWKPYFVNLIRTN